MSSFVTSFRPKLLEMRVKVCRTISSLANSTVYQECYTFGTLVCRFLLLIISVCLAKSLGLQLKIGIFQMQASPMTQLRYFVHRSCRNSLGAAHWLAQCIMWKTATSISSRLSKTSANLHSSTQSSCALPCSSSCCCTRSAHSS